VALTAAEARAAIAAFAAGNRTVERAETMLRKLDGASGSILFRSESGGQFVAKGTRNQRGLVAEHVVARLGQLLEAPVGDVALLDVPEPLRSSPEVAAMGLGLAHATRFIENLTNREALAYTDVPGNRARFGRLCALYSLSGANDWQLFYTTGDRLVHSLDHGHFFPNGPNWTAAGLAAAPPATVDPWFAAAALTNVELADARARLATITDDDIAEILNGPPPEWTFTADDRVALGNYLRSRRDHLLTLLPEA
jgi:HipA-like protein